MKIRVSLGTAIVLGLREGLLAVPPTTGYFLLSSSQGCLGACGFCPQAQSSVGNREKLSRVGWPSFPLLKVTEAVSRARSKKHLRRICIQATNYEDCVQDLLQLVHTIRDSVDIPVSVSCFPLSKTVLSELKTAGVRRIGIALDAATPELFSEVKGIAAGGPYRWKSHLQALSNAQEIFGKKQVTTHLIVGLGETEKQVCEFLQAFIDLEIRIGLFAFTPIPGTSFELKEAPALDSYRRVQLARALIHERLARVETFEFDENDQIASFGITWRKAKDLVGSGQPFQTSGCPQCNRPFYNESVRGPWYNFPRKLTTEESRAILREVLEQNLFQTS
ncbi:MAG: radical SAM protein [Candidatus Hodarchaeales archaeon]